MLAEHARASASVSVAVADAVMRIASNLVHMRAETRAANETGTATRVVDIDATAQFKFGHAGIAAATAFKIEFRCARGTRTCPISKEECTNDCHAVMRADERTGLLALYMHCHPCSAKQGLGRAEAAAGYCLVGFLSKDETSELHRLGAFEKARLRIATRKAELAKLTWRCNKCDRFFPEAERPLFECCADHRIQDQLVCDECRSWEPCERHDSEY
jgi:hypothetical protein